MILEVPFRSFPFFAEEVFVPFEVFTFLKVSHFLKDGESSGSHLKSSSEHRFLLVVFARRFHDHFRRVTRLNYLNDIPNDSIVVDFRAFLVDPKFSASADHFSVAFVILHFVIPNLTIEFRGAFCRKGHFRFVVTFCVLQVAIPVALRAAKLVQNDGSVIGSLSRHDEAYAKKYGNEFFHLNG